MKKIILFLTLITILTGCQSNNNLTNEISNIPTIADEIIEDIPEEPEYIDNNNVKVSLYNGKNKATSYSITLTGKKDIGVFDVYYTDIEKLNSSNTKTNFLKYYNEYENIENHKNGFYITFEADNKKMESLILDASDTYNLEPYLYVYLYDDIHQEPNTYYSHLKKKDMNESTIISSIKLYLAYEVEKITSPITLTVFTYDTEDDFDEFNLYRRNSSYTIEIETKK